MFVLLILCVFFRKTKRGRCAAEKLHKFLGQSKQTELVPGTRKLKRKLYLVFLSLEALLGQALICRLAVPAGSHEVPSAMKC